MKKIVQAMILLLLLANLAVAYQSCSLLKNGAAGELRFDSPALAAESMETSEYRRGMYSWEDAPYLAESKAELYATLEALQVNELYQFVPDADLYSDDLKALTTELPAMGIAPYYLCGEPAWGLDPAANSMIDAIHKVAAFNKVAGKNRFQGIVFDVEPYGTSQWDHDSKAAMHTYLTAMTTAYNYAKEKDLRVILCIPNWYDIDFLDVLETLIANACDEVAVMNYNRAREMESVENEIAFAEKHKKPLSCIFEFQAPGFHELTENETYYNSGLDMAQQNFEALRKHYGYDKINYAYHYYKPVRALLTGEK